MLQKIIWTPEARNAEEWEFDRGNPKWALSYPIEQATGWGWTEFIDRLDAMYPSAWRALLWALRTMPLEKGGSGELRLRLDAVEIDDWNEIDFAVPCPRCEAWIARRADLDHECPLPEVEAEGDEEPEPEPEPKKGKKKAAEPGEA